MSRYELVGLYDCPWYAKAEKIVDQIVTQNPGVEFNKEMLDQMHWKEFMAKMNIRHGWHIQRSPCVYEVLVDREGKARLIGDINDFCEFALLYFGILCDFSTSALKNMVISNRAMYGRAHERHHHGDGEIFNIGIINCPMKTLEFMLTQLLSPMSIFPYGLQLQISIFDEYTEKRVLDGLIMEIVDMASPLLYKARTVTTLPMAFYKCHLVLLMEDFTRTLMEDPREWLDRVEFKVVRIMNAFNCKTAKITDCRILVGGEGPSCYIAEICRKMTPYSSCGPGKVIASGQYVVQCAKAEIGRVGSLPSGVITRLHAYGWPGLTGCYVEVRDATVRGGNYSMRGPGIEIPLAEMATKSNYIFTQFSKDFLISQKRLLAYATKRPNRSMCMAESAITTIHTWLMCDPLVRLMGDGVKSVTPSAAQLISSGLHQSPNTSCLPVLNVGVECLESDFPVGTFMLQPSLCVSGKWQPLGKVSEKTSDTIVQEVSNLWALRQKLIYRDVDISAAYPDFDQFDKEIVAYRPSLSTQVTQQAPVDNNKEFAGEDEAFEYNKAVGSGIYSIHDEFEGELEYPRYESGNVTSSSS